jgi:hypothetical protein
MSTKNNWFNILHKENTGSKFLDFNIDIDPYFFTPVTFLHACCNQALELNINYDNLFLAYSGGLDSEFILKLYKDLNLKITPILISTGYNKEEYDRSKEFLKTNNISCEVIELSNNDFIDQLKEKTIDNGFPVLLSGVPLIISEYINSKNGYLITGYGDPFENKFHPYTDLKFSFMDYYLDVYDNKHPSAFFTYSIEVLYSLINDINYKLPLQQAKANLYNLEYRPKFYWHDNFYQIQRELIKDNKSSLDVIINYKRLNNILNTYRYDS